MVYEVEIISTSVPWNNMKTDWSLGCKILAEKINARNKRVISCTFETYPSSELCRESKMTAIVLFETQPETQPADTQNA